MSVDLCERLGTCHVQSKESRVDRGHDEHVNKGARASDGSKFCVRARNPMYKLTDVMIQSET